MAFQVQSLLVLPKQILYKLLCEREAQPGDWQMSTILILLYNELKDKPVQI